MADTFDAKKYGAYLSIPFVFTNATTGEAATDLAVSGGTSTGVAMPASGSVVAITAQCAAITAGTITLNAHSASTEFTEAGAPAPALSSANDTNGTYASVRPGALTFSAGDVLGISMTTTTTLNPTNTLDGNAVLIVQLDA